MDYKGPIEAALSTDLRGEPHNFSLWDINTGTQLVGFKGNKANPIPKCLQVINRDYFITATDNLLQIWSIFNKKCQDQKIFLPSRPSVLSVSPCGNFLIAGISEMIYIWQIYSGNLLAHIQRHYQAVPVIKLNGEGTYLFSGGEDGVVLAWSFADLISQTHTINEPKFSWQHHSAQVTDIHISHSCLCLTSSTDMTVNVYNYITGKRLYCISMPSPIWSIVMNKNETRIFAGSQEGNIYETATSSLSLSLREADVKPIFVGHKSKVISMLISLDGSKLVSASTDSSCKIWDIYSKKLLQDIKHQAPLANLTSILVPDSLALTSMTQSQAKPPLPIKPLKRNLFKPPRDTTLMAVDLFEETSTPIVHVRNKMDHWIVTSTIEQPSNEKKRLDIVEKPQQNLQEKMNKLYMLSAEKIFKDAAQDCLKEFKDLASLKKQRI